MRKSIFLSVMVFVAVTMLTGCGAQGRLYGKSKVLEYILSNPRNVTLNLWQKIHVAAYSWILRYMAER